MACYTRRQIIAATIGIPLTSHLLLTGARASPQFELGWTQELTEVSTVTDTVSVADEQTAVAVRSESTQQPETPDIVALDGQGVRVWDWTWPESRSDSLEFVQALAPAPDGGVYFAGPTVYGAGGSMLVGKVDADRTVEWHFTFSEHRSETFLVAPTSPGLILIGYDVEPSTSHTYTYGIDTTEQEVSWENNPLNQGSYGVYSVVAHQDGYILAGETQDAGLLARISEEGELDWEQTFTDPEISIRGLTENTAGEIVGVGGIINGGGDVQIVAVGENGQQLVRTTPDFELLDTPFAPKIVSDPDGGYVCTWAYSDRDEIFLGKLTPEGANEFNTHVDPWEAEFLPRVQHVVRLGDEFMLVGEGSSEDTESNRTWALGVSTIQNTPTVTESSSPTLTESTSVGTTPASSYTTNSESRSTTTRTAESPPPDTTSTTGPGFGVLGAILGIAGGRYIKDSLEQATVDEE